MKEFSMRFKMVFISVISLIAIFADYSFSNADETKRISVNRNIEYIRLTPRSYMVITYANLPGYGRIGTNHLLYIKNERAFLFDSPNDNSVADELYRWVNESLNARIAAVFISHWHKDHSGGLETLHKSGVKSYCHEKTRGLMAAVGLIPPQNTFADYLTIEFEGTRILLAFPGAGHTPDNSIGWIDEEKILFSGSVIRTLSDRSLGYVKDADLVEWPHTIEKIRKRFGDAALILPGHGDAGGQELLEHTAKLTELQVRHLPEGSSKGSGKLK